MNTLDFLARVRPGEMPYSASSDVRVFYDSSVFHFRSHGNVIEALGEVAEKFDCDQIGATVDVAITSADRFFEIPVGPADYGDLSAVDICVDVAKRAIAIAEEACDGRRNIAEIEAAVFFAALYRSECQLHFEAVVDEFEDRGDLHEIAGAAMDSCEAAARRISAKLDQIRRRIAA